MGRGGFYSLIFEKRRKSATKHNVQCFGLEIGLAHLWPQVKPELPNLRAMRWAVLCILMQVATCIPSRPPLIYKLLLVLDIAQRYLPYYSDRPCTY